jgi:hypothetical protein
MKTYLSHIIDLFAMILCLNILVINFRATGCRSEFSFEERVNLWKCLKQARFFRGVCCLCEFIKSEHISTNTVEMKGSYTSLNITQNYLMVKK